MGVVYPNGERADEPGLRGSGTEAMLADAWGGV
jgi:hypothetical protein